MHLAALEQVPRQAAAACCCQPPHTPRRTREHHGLDVLVDGGGGSLHHVRGQRPGAAHKAEGGCAARHLAADEPQALPHKRQLLQVNGVQRLELLAAADGRVQQRTLVVVNLKGDAKRGQRRQDVAAGRRDRGQRGGRWARRADEKQTDVPTQPKLICGTSTSTSAPAAILLPSLSQAGT